MDEFRSRGRCVTNPFPLCPQCVPPYGSGPRQTRIPTCFRCRLPWRIHPPRSRTSRNSAPNRSVRLIHSRPIRFGCRADIADYRTRVMWTVWTDRFHLRLLSWNRTVRIVRTDGNLSLSLPVRPAGPSAGIVPHEPSTCLVRFRLPPAARPLHFPFSRIRPATRRYRGLSVRPHVDWLTARYSRNCFLSHTGSCRVWKSRPDGNPRIPLDQSRPAAWATVRDHGRP